MQHSLGDQSLPHRPISGFGHDFGRRGSARGDGARRRGDKAARSVMTTAQDWLQLLGFGRNIDCGPQSAPE
ncbi:MAG: hypothetical protein GKR97_02850 [Rhizobiaceae bacterium]|nr:hypothetical protein [Rhizobiaceae bacterium]